MHVRRLGFGVSYVTRPPWTLGDLIGGIMPQEKVPLGVMRIHHARD